MEDERKKRMELLKKVNRRKQLLAKLSFIKLKENPLLSEDENRVFCKKAYDMLDTHTNKIIIQGKDSAENIYLSIQYLKELNRNLDVNNKEGRLIFSIGYGLEAVLLEVQDVFDNLETLLDLTEFSSGNGDFMLVAEDFHFGLVIERTEYCYEISIWGDLLK